MPADRVNRIHIPAPTTLNTVSAPTVLKDNEAAELSDFIVRYPGKIEMRGPLRGRADVGLTNFDSAWVQGDFVLMGGNVTTNNVRQVNMQSLAVSSTNSPIASVVSVKPPYAQIESNVWGQVESPINHTKLMKWTTTPTYTLLANGPTDFTDVIAFQNRLLVWGGVPAGGGSNNQYALYWSDQHGPTADTVANWQDDVSGLINQATFFDHGTPVAMAHCGKSLAFCFKDSIWLLSGTAPGNWSVKQVSTAYGCLTKRSISEVADGFYFLSNHGYVFTDGVSFQLVSQPINTILNVNIQQTRGGGVGTSPVASAGPMLTHFLAMWCPGPTVARNCFLLYNTETGGWMKCTLPVMSGTAGLVIRTDAHVGLYNDQYVWLADYVTAPEWVVSVAVPFGGRDYDGTNYHDIKPIWTTGALDLAGPGHRAKLNRIVTDYTFQPVFGTPLTSAWTVGFIDAFNTSYGNDVQLAPQVNQINALGDPDLRLRSSDDVFIEVDEVALNVTWPGGSDLQPVNAASIQGINLEYEPTQRGATRTF